MGGPLAGLMIVELAGLGPGPFAAMMLADHGAEVIRVERDGMISIPNDPLLRGRRSIALDLREEGGREVVRRLAARADGLIEGYRPGVLERLELDPAALMAANPRLVVGRVTGWGREGPLAAAAGHDINYLALTGLLHAIGPTGGAPVPPLNLVADFAGGGMMLAFGMVAALLAARGTGKGELVDVAMTDGASVIATLIHGMRAAGQWTDRRGANLLDGGYPLYGCFECADGRHVAIGALEPRFRDALLSGLGLAGNPLFEGGAYGGDWRLQRKRLATIFLTRTRDEWVRHFAGMDACLTPVLTLEEATMHPHNRDRGTFIEIDGVLQPAPAPRFADPAAAPTAPRSPGADGASILVELGYDEAEIERLIGDG